jgi:predicted dehydrogenase
LVNFEFRQQPARLKMRELIESGAIGQIEHLSYTAFTSGSRVPLRPYGWLFDRNLGGGWIGAFGSHAIDTIRWLMGEIIAASAQSRIIIPERPDQHGAVRRCDAEDAFSAWFELESGATASVDTSFASSVSLPPRIIMIGTEGVLENTADVQVTLRAENGTKERFDFEPPLGDPHTTALLAWTRMIVDAVRSRHQISPSFADGLACARVMDQLRMETPVICAHGDA